MTGPDSSLTNAQVKNAAAISLMPPEDAWRILKSTIVPLEPVPVLLPQALQCFLAEPLVAKHDVPAVNRAAVDGYAICCEDTHLGSAQLTVNAPGAPVCPGTCSPIVTGEPTPEGTTAVIRLEQGYLKSATSLYINEPIPRGKHIIKKAQTATIGSTLLPSGKYMRAGQLGICSLAGYDTVSVIKRPRVAIIAFNQDQDTSSTVPGQQRFMDITSSVLSAALKESLYEIASIEQVSPTTESIKAAITEALSESDVILVTGGMSTHRPGPLLDVIPALGGSLHYNGINIKPGRRQVFAEVNGKHIFGLPGNLLGALVGLHEFVLPGLRLLMGCAAKECLPSIRLPLMRTVEVGGTREHRILVKLQNTKYGPGLIPLVFSSSADAISASRADGTARVPVGRLSVAAGQYIEFRPWGSGNFSNHCSAIGDQYVER